MNQNQARFNTRIILRLQLIVILYKRYIFKQRDNVINISWGGFIDEKVCFTMGVVYIRDIKFLLVSPIS